LQSQPSLKLGGSHGTRNNSMRYSRSNHGTRNNSIRQGRARSTTVASATNIKELNLIQHITQQLTVASFRRLARSIRTPWFALGPWPQPRRPTCARDRSPVLDFVAKTPPPLLLLLLGICSSVVGPLLTMEVATLTGLPVKHCCFSSIGYSISK
jgi:hypothetical protein